MVKKITPLGKKTTTKSKTIAAQKTKTVSSRKMVKKIDKFFDKPVEIPKVQAAIHEEVSVSERKPLFAFVSKKMFLRGISFLFVAALIGIAGYFYFQYKKATAVDAGKNEIAGYVSKIGKFMILPADETPTMATVADKEKLSAQAFFAKAENGDKVLFFSKSQKAILYRPSANMIIEATAMAGGVPAPGVQSAPVAAPEKQAVAAPVVAEESKPVEAAPAEVKKQANVVVNNGTSTKGLAKTISEKISQIEGVTIVAAGNAKGVFAKTVVVDLSGGNDEIAQEIAKTLGGEVGELPNGEIKPEGDILVIGGKQ